MQRRDFTSIRTPPDTGNADLNSFLNSLKENIELLAALRGDAANHAVVKGDIQTDYPETPTGGSLATLLSSLTALQTTVRKLMVDLKT